MLDLFVERRIKMHDPQANVWKGAAAGLAAGLAATWVMTQFQHLSGKLSEPPEKEDPQHSAKRGKQESAQQNE